MFKFSNRFQYNVSPPGEQGGGGLGTLQTGFIPAVPTVGNTSSPTLFNNVYFDAALGTPFTEYVLYPGEGLSGVNYYRQTYNSLTLNPIAKINIAGDSLDNPSAVTWTPSMSSICRIKRYYGVGKQVDYIDWLALTDSGSSFFSRSIKSYLALQLAVPVAQFKELTGGAVTSTTLLGHNSVTNMNINEPFRLNKSLSRGDENGSSWSFFKTDAAGSVITIPAILGVDYEFISGDFNSDEIEIQFLTSFNFQVKLTVSGYTFNNNPYEILPSVAPNTTVNNYNFNTVEPEFGVILTFPKVDLEFIVPETAQLGTDPFETYVNQVIQINPILLIDSGIWQQFPLDDLGNITVLSKSEAEWRDEMLTRCRITLEVRDINTNELILERDGLDPYTISLSVAKNYILEVKTKLR